MAGLRRDELALRDAVTGRVGYDSREAIESRSTFAFGSCATWTDNGVPNRVKAGLFQRSSILFRPQHIDSGAGIFALFPCKQFALPTTVDMVEPPGTAPGSEPSIKVRLSP